MLTRKQEESLISYGLNCLLAQIEAGPAKPNVAIVMHAPVKPKTRPPMTAKQKNEVSRRMKKYWASRRKKS